jgi:hypothetical protein
MPHYGWPTAATAVDWATSQLDLTAVTAALFLVMPQPKISLTFHVGFISNRRLFCKELKINIVYSIDAVIVNLYQARNTAGDPVERIDDPS